MGRLWVPGVDDISKTYTPPFGEEHGRYIMEMDWKIAKVSSIHHCALIFSFSNVRENYQGENVTVKTVRSQFLYRAVNEGEPKTFVSEPYSCNLDVAPLDPNHERELLSSFVYPPCLYMLLIWNTNPAGVTKVGQVIVDYSSLDLSKVETTKLGEQRYYKVVFEIRTEFGATKGFLVFYSWIKGKRYCESFFRKIDISFVL